MTPEHKANYDITLSKLKQLEEAYGHKLIITSGYRSLEKHLAIYAAKGITDQKKIPMKSRHLSGEAVDVVPANDRIGHLHDWVLNNIKICEDIGLWFEDFNYSKTWLHVQIVPPKSGNRFFIP